MSPGTLRIKNNNNTIHLHSMTTREPSNSTEFWAEWTQTASGGVHCCVLSFLTIKTKPHLKWYEVTHTSTLQSGLNTQSNPICCRTALDKHYLREHSGNLLHKTCIMKNQIKANHGEGGGGRVVFVQPSLLCIVHRQILKLWAALDHTPVFTHKGHVQGPPSVELGSVLSVGWCLGFFF